MLWVDHQNYFGPDRRRKLGGLRVRERRRENSSGPPPSVSIAMRQLRMRVMDAHGAKAAAFGDRTRAVAMLADMHQESETAHVLSSMALRLARGAGNDVRPALYHDLDRAHAALRDYH